MTCPAVRRGALPARSPLSLLLLPLLACVVFVAAGCARYGFSTNPAGATVEFSRTGAEPWMPVALDESGAPLTTPFNAAPPAGGYAFIRGVRDGYIASEPELVRFSYLSPLTWFGFASTPELVLTKTRAEIARENLASGLVFYREEWVRPDDAGLVERDGIWLNAEEAVAHDRRAAGLVLVDGEWITAAEADARSRADLLARGYEEYRGRLFPPEEAGRRRAIDAQVERLLAQRAEDPNAVDNANFEDTGRTPKGLRVRVFNATSIDLEVLMSGPDSRSVALNAYEERTVDLLAGDYVFAALPVVPGVFEYFVGSFTLEETYTYTFTYIGLELGRELDQAERDAATRIERPDLNIPDVRLPEGYQENRRPPGQNGQGGGRQRGGGGGGGGGNRGGG